VHHVATQVAKQREAVDHRNVDIEHEQVEPPATQLLEPLVSVGDERALEALGLQHPSHTLGDEATVIDDQSLRAHGDLQGLRADARHGDRDRGGARSKRDWGWD
jgi:hypothetical protein